MDSTEEGGERDIITENTSGIYVTRMSPMIAKLAFFLFVRLHSSSWMHPEVSCFIGTF
jgi:hypothetical protein